MMDALKAGKPAEEAIAGARTHYGRVTADQGMVKLIDPRKE